jgi:hypothetical protein
MMSIISCRPVGVQNLWHLMRTDSTTASADNMTASADNRTALADFPNCGTISRLVMSSDMPYLCVSKGAAT